MGAIYVHSNSQQFMYKFKWPILGNEKEPNSYMVVFLRLFSGVYFREL